MIAGSRRSPLRVTAVTGLALLAAFVVAVGGAQAQGSPNTPATGAPTISGTARVGEVLVVDASGIADADGMANASFSYGWLIEPEPEPFNRLMLLYRRSSYVVPPEAAGRSIVAAVTFRDDIGQFESLRSAPTAVVAPAVSDPPRNLAVDSSEPGVLSVEWEAPAWSVSAWFDGSTSVGDGGSPITSYTVQWREDAGSWTNPADVSEAVVTAGTMHTIRDLTDGVTYVVRVLATNAVGESEPTATPTSGDQPPAVVGPSALPGGGGGGGSSGPSPSVVDFEWTVKRDIETLDSGHDMPTGMWSDGATLWLLENGDGADDAVYAYDLDTGQRDEDREFELNERNRAPRGVWSDGKGAVWVSDSGRDHLFAYDVATGERLEARDIELDEGNADARGIWSGSETMWVLDDRANAIFAYDLDTGALLAEYDLDSANGSPVGIWSDGVTLWVSDPGSSPRTLFAYRLPVPPDALPEDPLQLERVRGEDFTKLSNASNNSPRGIWADGDLMYVADESDGKVYTYNMPDAIDARLASLTLSGVDIGEFDPGTTDYEGVIAEGVTETVIMAAAVQRRTDVEVTPDDADGDETNGHQIVLAGVTEITVTVTSADGIRMKTYRVTFEPTVTEVALSPTWTSFEWPGADGVAIAEAGLPEEVVVVYTWDETAGSWLGHFPGLDDVPGLNTLTAFSSGATYWVAAADQVAWTVELKSPGAP